MKKRVHEKKHISKSGILISASFGLCAAIIILLVLLIIFSLVGLATEKPHSLLSPVSFFAIYCSSFFGGFAAIKKNKGRDALLCGLSCGCFIAITFSILLWLAGFLLDAQSTPMSWLFRALTVVFAIIGSLLGTTKSSKPKKKKRRK